MIPMSCPSCGRRGTVPPDRLNTRMHCKKCDAVFYMDRSGKIVLGDPDDAARRANKPNKPKKVKKDSDPVDMNLVSLLGKAPTPVKLLVVVGAVVLIAFIAGVRLPKFSVSKNLDNRIEIVGEAFAYSAPGDIQKVAAPGTGGDLQQWYDKLRPTFKFEGQKRPGSLVSILKIGNENPGADKSPIVIRVVPPLTPDPVPEVKALKEALKKNPRAIKPETQPGYNADGSFDLPTVWVQNGGTWLLDGAQTLQAAQAPEKKDEKKKK